MPTPSCGQGGRQADPRERWGSPNDQRPVIIPSCRRPSPKSCAPRSGATSSRASHPTRGNEVAELDLGRLLIAWFNWRDRFVSEAPRTVHVSATLAASPASVTHAGALAAIRREIESGEDLTHRLSSGVAITA